MDKVYIKQNFVNFSAFAFTDNFTRVFYCNAIEFVNQGTSLVYINDVFLIPPGASQKNNGNQNEIDLTVYKASFPFQPGLVNNLQIWVKVDSGTAEMIRKLTSYSGSPIISRRKQNLRYTNHTKPNSNF
jgi:hypothetical protein